MNICYLVRSFSTQAGTESYVHCMSMALARLGHSVHIVSLTGRGKRDLEGLDDRIVVHQLNLKEEALRGFWLVDRVIPVAGWCYGQLIGRILPDLVRRHAIDIIEATDWGLDAWVYLGKRKVPVCVRLHGYPGFKDDADRGVLKQWPRNRLYWSLFRKHLLGADLVTGVSESYIRFARDAWELNDRVIQRIPISINLDLFQPSDTPREDQSILFVGRLEKSKGIEVLDQAFSLVLREIPHARLYLAGQDYRYRGSQQTWAQHLIDVYGKERIIYLGSLSTQELVRYYRLASLCVVPSLYEAGGTAMFEAMACSCPVVASDVGGLGEVITDRQTGLLIQPGDSEALARALVELLQQPHLRNHISRNALDAVRSGFDINSIAKQTLDAYRQTIKTFKTRSQ